MNSFAFLFLILAFSPLVAPLVATTFNSTDSLIDNVSHLFDEYEKIHKEEQKTLDGLDAAIQDFKYSVRRPRDVFICGQRILKEVVRICGGTAEQEKGSEIDVSKCCNSKCNDDFIRNAMCPNKSIP